MMTSFRALFTRACTLALGVVACTAPQAHAQSISSQLVISGLTRPVWMTHAPGDFTRVFVVEQRGSGGVASSAAIKIYGLPNYNFIGTFATLTGVSTSSEQGLLGMAFHPNYTSNGKVYLYYTAGGLDTLAVFTRNPGNPNLLQTPGTVIFTQSDPASNHNGGWLSFGPDGYLYLASGDGGGANDAGAGHVEPMGNGQSLNTTLGKMLRFDVDGTNGPGGLYGIPATNPFAGSGDPNIRKEIWAYGLRNHWRNDFDPLTGDLYIADVGQNAWEEVNVRPRDVNGNQGGLNYGWRCFESDVNFNTSWVGCGTYGVGNVPILLKYGHGSAVAPTFRTGCSLTGGMVYRGCAIPGLEGTYFFADYCGNWIYSVRANPSNNTYTAGTDRTASLVTPNGIGNIVSFGRDAYGELYIIAQGNAAVYKIIRNGGTAPADCNVNGRPDCQEILDGSAADENRNAIPDSCEAPFAISLSSPANGATNQPLTPTLTWTGASNATSYSVTVATDAGLTNVVDSTGGLVGTSYNVSGGALSAGQTYYWGVTAVNGVGSTASTPFSYSFVTTPPPCVGDINGDGDTNTADLTIMLGNWGAAVPPGTNGDLTGDGTVNTADLTILLGDWGC